ncbi:MAG: PP2C family serine/threonine-protein phosphatase [Cyanobacteriota bacterium]
MAWRAVVCSSIGTRHQKQQLPCQDYGNYCIFENAIAGVVADGAGSAKHSDVGAQLAVETVMKIFTEIERSPQPQDRLSSPLNLKEARELFTKLVKEVVATLEQQSVNNNYSINDLACTLLVFVATPDWFAAMQIGDGFIVVRLQGEEYKLLFHPDKGEFVNQTTFVTSANALDEMQVKVLSGKQTFICASTDGLERVAIQMRDWTPFSPFFKPLEQYLGETHNSEEDHEYIKNFLDSERLNARTDDDKTLLLCLYNRAAFNDS